MFNKSQPLCPLPFVRCTMAEDSEQRKTRTIGVRVDEALFQLLQREAAARGETVANYVRSSAKMRATGRLVEQGRKKFNEY